MSMLAGQGWWRWVVCGSAAGAVILTSWHWAGRSVLAPPEWKRRLDREIPAFVPSPSSAVTEEAQRLQARILDDLLRRPKWGTDESRELCAILRAGYPRPLSDRRTLSRDDLSAAMIHMAAGVAMIARLEVGAPVSPAARAEIIRAFVAELEEPFPERRSNAAMALIVTRSIEDRFVRAAVESLLDDPNPETAQVVAMQLAHYDHQRARLLASSAADQSDR